VIRSILEPFGYEIILATNAEDGLAIARKVSPDLILSDLHMPRQDGFMFIISIKSDPSLRQIPFVFLSSSVWGDKDQRRGLSLGAVRFILRPIEPQQLLREVEECLNQS
jgi:two-component system cell cycle response regulator